jgi:transposase-like protein
MQGSGRILNWTRYPSDVIALGVFRRLRYELSLRNLSGMFLMRRVEFTYSWLRVFVIPVN